MIDKSKIIDTIKKEDDEFVAEINIPDWHKKVLKQRLKDFEEGNMIFYNWEEVKNSIFAH